MGFYVNPKNRGFWESIRSKIYVDKTGLISCTNEYINTEQKFICVSRPRRFGKSMALKMPAAAAYGQTGAGGGTEIRPVRRGGNPADQRQKIHPGAGRLLGGSAAGGNQL